METLFKILKTNNLTISFAESMTGGYLSSELTKINGASKVFKGSVIAYSNEVKINLLKVLPTIILKDSVVSESVSISMAKGLQQIINSDIYVSVTGNAGPTLEAGTNQFSAYYTIIYDEKLITDKIVFKNNDRLNNIEIFKNEIISKIIKMIKK